jgi:hypothetical protein
MRHKRRHPDPIGRPQSEILLRKDRSTVPMMPSARLNLPFRQCCYGLIQHVGDRQNEYR